eukprot:CAMPEP_0117444136 /NCGR_PEP_ID=MMETSP0759-20121206/5073_1 /TAXON_ID=63605 /ORGANISM="Percolomonas cosmopolitus, Strain WS" /LENGTH=520 /DNA_ID=CAMNT_0005236169 /DNA_START=165 /DNA_END=1727 /DNA_ORIENTATION=+
MLNKAQQKDQTQQRDSEATAPLSASTGVATSLVESVDAPLEPLQLAVVSKKGDQLFRKHLKQDLFKLQFDTSYDICLKFKSKSYKLHCLVLMQSPYLASFLPLEQSIKKMAELERQDVSEFDRKQAVEEIDVTEHFHKDVSPAFGNASFERIIRYLYTGNLRIPREGTELYYLDIFKSFQLSEACNAMLGYLGTYLTPLDACRIVDTAYTKGHRGLYETCLRLIGINAEQIFSSDACLSFSYQLLKHCVISDGFDIEEQSLFEGIRKWITHHADLIANEAKDEPVNIIQDKKRQFTEEKWRDIEEFIRWPLMNADYLYEEVEPTGLISPYLLEEAYQFFALSNTKNASKYMPRGLRTKNRGGVKWCWSTDIDRCHSNITVSQKGTVITKGGSSSHTSVIANRGFKTGKHTWQLKLNSPSHWVATGVCFRSQLTSQLTNDYSNLYGASSQNQLYNTTGNLTTWNQNDIITCTLVISGGSANFNLKTNSGTDISATIVMTGEELTPISNLYTTGNELVLLKR